MAKPDISREGYVSILDPEQTAIIKDLEQRLSPYTESGPSLETLKTRVDAGSLFEFAAPSVKRILFIYGLLKDCALEQIPTVRLRQILGHVDSVNNELNGLKNYGVDTPTPPPRRTDLLSRLDSVSYTLYSEVVADIVKANMLSGRTEVDAAKILEDLKEKEERANETAKQLEKILESARTAAGELGVSQQAIHFKHVADSYKQQSWAWLTIMVIAIGFGFGYGLYYLPYHLDTLPLDVPTSRLTQLLFNKILVVSLLFFAIGWLARNFSAARHNFATNQHRQTALSTFETIVNGVKDDPQARNAVLVYAAQAIFMPTTTGYGKGEPEVQQVSPFIELVTTARKAVEPKP